MKKVILLIVAFVFAKSAVMACDVCGAYMGIMPNEKNNFISVYNRYRAFKGDYFTGSNKLFPDGSYFKTEHAGHNTAGISMYEVFRVTELRARYFVHPRVELNMILPYATNKEVVGSSTTIADGLGDLILTAGFHLFDDKISGDWRHRFIVGAGVKLATGNDRDNGNGQRITILNQPGTGANDAIVMATYLMGFNHWGLMLNGMGKLNGTNAFNERIGNSIAAASCLFYKIDVGCGFQVIPSLALNYENTKGEYLKDVLQNRTGMQALLGGGGIQVAYRKFSFDIMAQVSLDEPPSKNSMFTTFRMVTGLTYSFSQGKYIFHRNDR